jgi:hypothetical protein
VAEKDDFILTNEDGWCNRNQPQIALKYLQRRPQVLEGGA